MQVQPTLAPPLPRPPRLDPPGGWHHVFNRRPPGRLLVRSPLDRADFLALLAPLEARFGVEVHAYAVMDTHFHLLVRSRAGGLAAAMRDLQHRWSLALSARYGEVGPAFQARYGSRLIEDEHYLAVVLAYIHLNPVVAGLAPSLAEADQTSHPAYLGIAPPPWLHTATLIEHFGGIEALHEEVLSRARLPAEIFDQALEPIHRTQGPHTPPVRRSPEEAPMPDVAGIMRHLEAVLGRDLQSLGPPRVGAGPNVALHLAVWVLSNQTPLGHGEIAEAVGLQVRQVHWMVQAQQRRLHPEVARLARRFAPEQG